MSKLKIFIVIIVFSAIVGAVLYTAITNQNRLDAAFEKLEAANESADAAMKDWDAKAKVVLDKAAAAEKGVN